MPESTEHYLDLSLTEQAELLHGLAPVLGRRALVSDALKVALVKHVTEELVPTLQEALTQALPRHEVAIEVGDDPEKLRLYYPSAVENTNTYLRSSILLEFGGRNATLPQDTMMIVPDVAAHVPGLVFPTAQVTVLSPASGLTARV